MAEKDQFQTAEGLEGGLELMDEVSRTSQAGRPPAGAARKVAAVAAAVALALALAGCSMLAKTEGKSTMEASDTSMSASSSSSTQQETKWTDAASADAAAKAAEPASSSSAASSDGGVDNNLTEADVQQIVFDQGFGAYRYASLIEGGDGVWYWRVCVADVYNDDHFLLVDPYGNVTEQ